MPHKRDRMWRDSRGTSVSIYPRSKGLTRGYIPGVKARHACAKYKQKGWQLCFIKNDFLVFCFDHVWRQEKAFRITHSWRDGWQKSKCHCHEQACLGYIHSHDVNCLKHQMQHQNTGNNNSLSIQFLSVPNNACVSSLTVYLGVCDRGKLDTGKALSAEISISIPSTSLPKSFITRNLHHHRIHQTRLPSLAPLCFRLSVSDAHPDIDFDLNQLIQHHNCTGTPHYTSTVFNTANNITAAKTYTPVWMWNKSQTDLPIGHLSVRFLPSIAIQF